MKCCLIPSNSGYEVITPYMGSFISELKTIVPASARNYNPNTKRWSVSAQYGRVVGALIAKCFGQWVDVPQIKTISETGIIELLYLGQSKMRDNGIRAAYGYTHPQGVLIGGWYVLFPEKVLKGYFDPNYIEQKEIPEKTTLYATLGIKPDATTDQIKTGYRRMVKQWHPDVCKDPDAHEIFIGIQKAYETLINPKMKARYDVGLKMSEGMEKPKEKEPFDIPPYRAPLKCGNLLCEYLTLGMKHTVTKIIQWEDIYDSKGRTMISSWKIGDNEPTLIWK